MAMKELFGMNSFKKRESSKHHLRKRYLALASASVILPGLISGCGSTVPAIAVNTFVDSPESGIPVVVGPDESSEIRKNVEVIIWKHNRYVLDGLTKDTHTVYALVPEYDQSKIAGNNPVYFKGTYEPLSVNDLGYVLLSRIYSNS